MSGKQYDIGKDVGEVIVKVENLEENVEGNNEDIIEIMNALKGHKIIIENLQELKSELSNLKHNLRQFEDRLEICENND